MKALAPEPLELIDDYESFFGQSPLLSASIRVTERCNLACRHCYVYDQPIADSKDRLTTAQIINIVSQLAELGCSKLFFTGGEPFLRDDLLEILDYAKTLGMGLAVSTNGTVATRKELEALADIPFDLFQVSIDGPPVYHNVSRGSGVFDAAAGTFSELHRLGFANRTLSCTVGDNNCEYLPEMVDVAQTLAATHISLTLQIEGGRASRISRVHRLASALDAFFRRMINEPGTLEFSRTSTIPVALVPTPLLNRYGKRRFLMCSYPQTIGIGADGNLAPCDGFFGIKRYFLGNALKSNLERLWNNQFAADLRHIGPEELTGVCSICCNLAICNGGCRANAAAWYAGNLKAPDPICQAFFDQGFFPRQAIDPAATYKAVAPQL